MDELLRSIIWRREDVPGHEWAQATSHDEGSQYYGTAIFVDEGKRCCLDYVIDCDTGGETVSVEVIGHVGDETVEIEILVDDDGVWSMNEEEIEGMEGCVDIDLNFSPITNTLPIRRLKLAVGESQKVSAAWLKFPSFQLERFDQTYTRLDERTYRYESSDGEFKRDLTVDDDGMVTNYPGLWIEESS